MPSWETYRASMIEEKGSRLIASSRLEGEELLLLRLVEE